MKIVTQFFLLTILLVFSACKNESKTASNPNGDSELSANESMDENGQTSDKASDKGKKYAHCWEGKLGGKIPVFFHYTIMDSVLSGEVTYLKTKGKKPIRILGTILPDDFYRMLEFDRKGNITGIWSLTIKGDKCSGTWYTSGESGWGNSAESKEFKVQAQASDSLIAEWDLKPDPEKIFGYYEYNYTKEHGNTGYLNLEKLTDYNANFEILGVASAPGFNFASIEETTVDFVGGKDTEFDFKIDDSEECDFKVKFYKGFAHVYYTKGYCNDGYFGHNSTVEGLFLKTK
jgi:hypothetical protein